MNAIKDKQRGKWRIIVSPKYTGTGKRQRLFFDSKELAEAKARSIREEGLNPASNLDNDDIALLALIKKQFGNDAAEVIRNLDFARKTIGGIPPEKRIDLETGCKAFIDRQITQGKNRRTIYSDRQALVKFSAFAGDRLPLIELTETRVNEYFETMKPGGTRLTQYARIKKFLNWCKAVGYLAINPMENVQRQDSWKANKDILKIEHFRRILFVVAGLEPIKPGESLTTRYLRLLPYYVLGGLAGLRRCEIIDSNPADPVIEWSDIIWNKNSIKVRHEIAKETKANDRQRSIPLEPAAKAWLSLVRQDSGRMVDISQSTLQRLNDELLHALRIKVPANGLRNSFASYGAACRSPGDVAKAMGDLESTIRQFYVARGIEPEEGLAWFGIRPTMTTKIIQMPTPAAAA
jgi:integrase